MKAITLKLALIILMSVLLSSCSSPRVTQSSPSPAKEMELSEANLIVAAFRDALRSRRVDFAPLWNDRLTRTGGFDKEPEKIRMYHVLQAVRDGIEKLPQYEEVQIDIPLEMVDSVHGHNHTYLSDLLGKTISRNTLQGVTKMDLLTALSLCEEIYTLGVSVDGRTVYLYFPRFSKQFQAGIKIPLLFKDPGIPHSPKKEQRAKNTDDSWLKTPVNPK